MKLLYFAWVRQMLGTHEETLALPSDVHTLGELAKALQARGGAYAQVFADVRRLRAAVNQNHAGWNSALSSGDEVAFFPPVTGG